MAKYTQADIEQLRSRFVRPLDKRMPARLALERAEIPRTKATDAPASFEALVERWKISSVFLLDFIRREFADDAELLKLAERILRDGREGLELIGGKATTTTAGPKHVLAGLEVVVRADGSRPAYLVRNDEIVRDSSPEGLWTALLTDVTRAPDIKRTLGSVGRIDITYPGVPFGGTAWLVGRNKDLIVTNRHVAQLFVNFEAGGVVMPGREAHVDFGHEFKGIKSRNRRPIVELVFCGATAIPYTGLNHSLLDIAVLRLDGVAADEQLPLQIGLGEQLANPQTQVAIIGYPAAPPSIDILGTVSETDRVLKLLFKKLWGYKRLAPGEIMNSAEGVRTLSHDASTLGGNSGSVLVGLDTLPMVTGLHYGGVWGRERANWAHVIENVLSEKGYEGLQYATLQDLCEREGVGLVEA